MRLTKQLKSRGLAASPELIRFAEGGEGSNSDGTSDKRKGGDHVTDSFSESGVGMVGLFGCVAGEWMPPAQAGKPLIIPVGGDPFAAGFNRERGKPDIRNQVACGRK